MRTLILILGISLYFISISYSDDRVYGLAQGCYVIRNPTTGKYLKAKYVKYKFEGNWPHEGTKFYFKPSGLGTFLDWTQASMAMWRSWP